MDNLDSYRELFPITQKYVFLNHAAVSAPSLRVVQAVGELMQEFSVSGITRYARWMGRMEEVRQLFAALIHAEAHEVAFVGNTSEGLSTIASGLNWRNGDVIVAPWPDFPTNTYPWLNLERYGVKVRFVARNNGRFGVSEVEQALGPGTRLLAVSTVDYVHGCCCDLKALGDLCRRNGLLFCVDAIQSLGVIPIDVRECGIHFLTAGGHKWLLATMGIGGLYVSSEVRDLVHPCRVGWKSVTDEEDFARLHFDLKPDARRFEPGTMNLLGIYALGAAIELIAKVGVSAIRERIFGLNDLFYQGLRERGREIITPMDSGERSGILSFIPHGDPAALFRYLTEKNILTSLRNGKIRLAPHFYNNVQDVVAFLKALDDFSGHAL